MNDLTRVVAAIQAAYGILAARSLAFLSLAGTCGCFGWAMAQATWLHFAMAGAFGLTVFLPVLWITRRDWRSDA